MSEEENFLSRWARRKRDAAKPAAPPAPEETARDAGEVTPRHKAASLPAADKPAGSAEPFIDLSKLPSLDSIGPTTDIRPFLQPGVPASLSRAALRRMWSADPAIRDYIGPSENAWDFTAPDSMPGFGPLLPTDDVKRLLAQVFGEERTEVVVAESEIAVPAPNTEEPVSHAETSQAFVDANEADAGITKTTDIARDEKEILQRTNNDIAMQKDSPELPSEITRVHRRHGGALPS